MSFDGVLLDHDSVRIKMAAFRREVKDYIALGHLVTDQVANRTYTSFINLDGTTYMRGLEFEGNYDARSFWLGGSATLLKTDWPDKTGFSLTARPRQAARSSHGRVTLHLR